MAISPFLLLSFSLSLSVVPSITLASVLLREPTRDFPSLSISPHSCSRSILPVLYNFFFVCIIFDMAARAKRHDGRNQWKAKMNKRAPNIKYVAKAFSVLYRFDSSFSVCIVSDYVMHSIYGLFLAFSLPRALRAAC